MRCTPWNSCVSRIANTRSQAASTPARVPFDLFDQLARNLYGWDRPRQVPSHGRARQHDDARIDRIRGLHPLVPAQQGINGKADLDEQEVGFASRREGCPGRRLHPGARPGSSRDGPSDRRPGLRDCPNLSSLVRSPVVASPRTRRNWSTPYAAAVSRSRWKPSRLGSLALKQAIDRPPICSTSWATATLETVARPCGCPG